MEIGIGHQTSRPGTSGAGVAHHPIVPVPGGQAFDPLGGTVAPISSFDITVKTNLLVKDGAIATQHDAWMAKKGKRGILIRQRDGGYQTSVTARLVVYDAPREYKHRQFLPVTFIWTVFPLPWLGASHIITLPFGSTAVTNLGNVPNRQPTFVLFPPVGAPPTPNITITNGTTGHSFTVGGTLVVGENYQIDCGARSITKNGTINWYVFFQPSVLYEEWFLLAPGTNTINTAWDSAAALTLSMTYQDTWG